MTEPKGVPAATPDKLPATVFATLVATPVPVPTTCMGEGTLERGTAETIGGTAGIAGPVLPPQTVIGYDNEWFC